MAIKKTIIFLSVVILLLAVISFLTGTAIGLPCGHWGTNPSPTLKYKDCTCIGLKIRDGLIGGGKIACLGIPVSYSCYHYTSSQQKEYVPCDTAEDIPEYTQSSTPLCCNYCIIYGMKLGGSKETILCSTFNYSHEKNCNDVFEIDKFTIKDCESLVFNRA